MKSLRALTSIAVSVLLGVLFGATMTTPLDHGYPDFGRQIATTDQRVLDEANVNIGAATDYGPFFVGNMPYIFIRAVTQVARYHVELEWSTDGTSANVFANDYLVSEALRILSQSVPVRGAFVLFKVQLSAYPNSHTTQAIMTSTPSNEVASLVDANVLIQQDNVSVAAVTTAVYTAGFTRGGWVHWSATFDDGVNYLIKLYAIRFDGTLRLLDVIDSANSRGGGLVFAPPYTLQVHAINADASARNLYLSVTFHPFYP